MKFGLKIKYLMLNAVHDSRVVKIFIARPYMAQCKLEDADQPANVVERYTTT